MCIYITATITTYSRDYYKTFEMEDGSDVIVLNT
jgi:hypothetical protein